MNTSFQKDLYRFYHGERESLKQRALRPLELQYIDILRKRQNAHGLMSKWYTYRLRKLSIITQIQIPSSVEIGDGFYIGHTGRIIINAGVKIGKNVNIATGVTIGQENRGDRQGIPTIGNQVWIGTNSVIVGGITIGDDVMIAPLTFVNFDVPEHSIVVGNPAKIISKNGATEGYIEDKV